MFEPPLVFRDTMASQQQQQPQQQQISLDGKSSGSGDITASGVGISSRRDSNSSQFGYGLSRITSSSSSLNLNAYLTDDSDHSIHSNVSNFSTRYNLKIRVIINHIMQQKRKKAMMMIKNVKGILLS